MSDDAVRREGWPWKAAVLGLAAGAVLEPLSPIALKGTPAALLFVDLPIKWFYPGREAGELLWLVAVAFWKAEPYGPQVTAFSLLVNAGLYVGAWAFVRAMRRGGPWRRAILLAAISLYFGGTLLAMIGFIVLMAAMQHAGR